MQDMKTRVVCGVTTVAVLVTLLVAGFAIHQLRAQQQSGAEQQPGGAPGSPGATTTIDGRYLPNPRQPFDGEINPNTAQSKPYWPEFVVPPKGG